jgi:hypothetical protein
MPNYDVTDFMPQFQNEPFSGKSGGAAAKNMSLFIPSAAGGDNPLPNLKTYKMRAYKTTAPVGYVFWNNTGSGPDTTAALSGFNPLELSGITVIGVLG